MEFDETSASEYEILTVVATTALAVAGTCRPKIPTVRAAMSTPTRSDRGVYFAMFYDLWSTGGSNCTVELDYPVAEAAIDKAHHRR